MNNKERRLTILAVDDSAFNLKILVELLRADYEIISATTGTQALELARANPAPDLIVMDVIMPAPDGLEVCRQLKADPRTRQIPVIFITGRHKEEDEIKGFEAGAVDYVTKPFNPVIVKARVKTQADLIRYSNLINEQKRLLSAEKEKSIRLLHNILPAEIAHQLLSQGSSPPRFFGQTSVMFTDFLGFTALSAEVDPALLFTELNDVFSAFDFIIEKNNCQRIKTIGDGYMAVCGLPVEDPKHAINLVQAGLDFLSYLRIRNKQLSGKVLQISWQVRIGINSGSAVGGIVGTARYTYDIFGAMVNTASRMEKHGEPGTVNISESTWQLVKDHFVCHAREDQDVKGLGTTRMFRIDPPAGEEELVELSEEP